MEVKLYKKTLTISENGSIIAMFFRNYDGWWERAD